MLNKQCLHKFNSVYYGSEWEIECSKCDKNVRDLYNKKDANKIVNNYLKNLKNENSKQRIWWQNIIVFSKTLPSGLQSIFFS